MKCESCGEDNGSAKKTCGVCGAFLAGWTINNVTGRWGHRNRDGSFTPYQPGKATEELQSQNADLLAALKLCLPVMEAHTEASHLTDGFRPRENANDRILRRVKDVIEKAEGVY